MKLAVVCLLLSGSLPAQSGAWKETVTTSPTDGSHRTLLTVDSQSSYDDAFGISRVPKLVIDCSHGSAFTELVLGSPGSGTASAQTHIRFDHDPPVVVSMVDIDALGNFYLDYPQTPLSGGKTAQAEPNANRLRTDMASHSTLLIEVQPAEMPNAMFATFGLTGLKPLLTKHPECMK
jgi:hypothetical protein